MSKYGTDNLFDIPEKIDKNSYKFDCYILDKLKKLKDIPAEKFNGKIRKIMREKSSAELLSSDMTLKEWDSERRQYFIVNYRCCPESRKARNYFCLILEHKNNTVTVTDGFLRSV